MLRRNFVGFIGVGLAIPAIVKAESLMKLPPTKLIKPEQLITITYMKVDKAKNYSIFTQKINLDDWKAEWIFSPFVINRCYHIDRKFSPIIILK